MSIFAWWRCLSAAERRVLLIGVLSGAVVAVAVASPYRDAIIWGAFVDVIIKAVGP